MMQTASLLSPVRRELGMSSHDHVAAELGVEILTGVHRAGLNLPPESDLIERFQVSRTVVREVMKTLAAKGLVISKTRVGTKVRDPSNWNFFDMDVLAWRVKNGLDEEFRQSLTEIRRAVEPAAAALAAQRRTAKDVATLRKCLSAMDRKDHTRLSFAEADLDFHLAIGAASGNPLMRSVASVIEAALIASFSQSSPVDSLNDLANTVNSHVAIVNAIEKRDDKAAAAAMLKVIDIGVERIQRAKKGRRSNGKK
jgi:DNA-binding FadR family transcriptional regulator